MHLWALPVESVFGDRAVREGADDPLERPVAVREEVRGQRILVSVSDEARRRGIRPGIKESEGRARDLGGTTARTTGNGLEVRPRDVSLEQARLEHAAELLFAFGPEVELGPPNLLFVEVGRSRRAIAKRLKRPVAELDDRTIAEAIQRVMTKAGHRSSVAVASDPDTARTLVEHLTRSMFAASGKRPRGSSKPKKADAVAVVEADASTALASLPLEAIVWTDRRADPEGVLQQRMRAAVSSLQLLGVRDVGRFASLPAAQISSRFGDAGALMARRATGSTSRPLRRFVPSERTVESFELDAVTEDLEPILFVLKRLFDRLEARLSARSRAVSAVAIRFVVEPSMGSRIAHDAARQRSSKRTETVELCFARATRRAAMMLTLARERLGGSLPGAVMAVTIEARALEPDHGAQLDLFTNRAKRIEEVSELVGRLQAALGERTIFSPAIADTHRPEAAWKTLPFDIDAALAEAPVEKPPRISAPTLVAPLAEQAGARASLPRVDAGLVVTTIPEQVEAPSKVEAPAWPKAIQRKPEDEPLPPLPPRPLELLPTPERVTLAKTPGVANEDGVITWRGRRLVVVRLGATERLEAEWWTAKPLARDYWVAEIADGRRLWLYAESTGGVFVHGIFD